jgi:anti-anti-sigma factor
LERSFTVEQRQQGGVVSTQEPQVGRQETSDWVGGHELSVEQTAWGTVVLARGELDVGSVVQLRQRLEGAAGSARVLLDLAEVTFIDSLSLATIVAAKRRLDANGRLAVVADHPYVLLIFEAGGLDAVVDVFRTRAEAEAHLAA